MKPLSGQKILICVIALALLSACAGVTPTMMSIKLNNLGFVIGDARKAEAGTYAPFDLQLAEDKYQKARQAINNGKFATAEPLIDEAELDAKIARERALAARAEKDAHAMRQSIQSLHEEAERIKQGKAFY